MSYKKNENPLKKTTLRDPLNSDLDETALPIFILLVEYEQAVVCMPIKSGNVSVVPKPYA